jgi:hypothetical protein
MALEKGLSLPDPTLSRSYVLTTKPARWRSTTDYWASGLSIALWGDLLARVGSGREWSGEGGVKVRPCRRYP